MRILIVLVSFLMLGACANTDMSDLQKFVDDVKALPPGGVSPVPEPTEVETYLYVAGDRRDPFVAEEGEISETETVVDSGISPDFNRRKEELEGFSLDSLRMVGTLEQDDASWGLVQTSDGTIHRVATDNYMGRNHGRIIEIKEDQIKMIELVQVGSGYQEQEAALSLGDGGE